MGVFFRPFWIFILNGSEVAGFILRIMNFLIGMVADGVMLRAGVDTQVVAHRALPAGKSLVNGRIQHP
jgi:hypothetical protein